MATFDLTVERGGEDFMIVELDSTGEGGEFEQVIEIDRGATLVSVLVEGVFIEFDALIDEQRVEQESENAFPVHESRAVRLFTKIIPTGSRNRATLLIRGILEVGRKAKISVVALLRDIRSHIDGRLSCTACKRLVRFIITLILTGMGIPDIPDDLIPTDIFEGLDPGQLPEAVSKILKWLNQDFVKAVLDLLRKLAGFMNEVLAPLDHILTAICKKLGFCTEAATESAKG